jgi:hypothetical protein
VPVSFAQSSCIVLAVAPECVLELVEPVADVVALWFDMPVEPLVEGVVCAPTVTAVPSDSAATIAFSCQLRMRAPFRRYCVGRRALLHDRRSARLQSTREHRTCQ